jgi:polyisoprenoid-binding protein YceI
MIRTFGKRTVTLALVSLMAAGCADGGVGAAGEGAVAAMQAASSLEDQGVAALADEDAPPAESAAVAVAGSGVTFTLAPGENEARYRVRERLVGFELPNEAVGSTADITGALTVGPDGAFLPGSSIVVSITGLRSDEDRRDGYLQRRLLGGAEFPTVELVPRELRGVRLPLPTSGSATAVLVGDLTVRGITRPTTWQVEANFDENRIVGTAATGFTFEEFQLTKPRVPAVLSVGDTIRLEYDFNLVATPSSDR